MSSVVIKLGSLVIRTLSKPIANKIKDQARQHERFRQICIRSAQAIHRWDMRFKLGLLQDTATQEKQAKREAAEAHAAKLKAETPTVKTEAQTLAEEDKIIKEKEGEKADKAKKEVAKPKVKIRPLSEAKAIDSGANFVSETFLLLVGVALILGENWRQSRKQKSRREDVSERLEELEIYEKSARKGMVELEKEVLRLREEKLRLEGVIQKKGVKQRRILPPEVYELEEIESKAQQAPEKQGLWDWIRGIVTGTENEDDSPNLKDDSSESPDVTVKASSTLPPSPSILSRMLPTKGNSESSEAPQIVTKRRDDTIATSAPKAFQSSDGRPSTK